MLYHTRYFYFEFDPRDYTSLGHLLSHAKDHCYLEHGKYFDEYDLQVGRLPDNAELHFFKASIDLPMNHPNENYLK
jgi:hypothetical protein